MKKVLLCLIAFNFVVPSVFASDQATWTAKDDEAMRLSDEAMELHRESCRLGVEGDDSLALTKYAEAVQKATQVISISNSLCFGSLQSCVNTLEVLRARDDENRHGLDVYLANLYGQLVQRPDTPENLKQMYQRNYEARIATMVARQRSAR